MILKHTAYILRLDETVGFNKSTDKEGEPIITFWTEGQYVFSLKGPECYRLLEAVQDALKENEKHE